MGAVLSHSVCGCLLQSSPSIISEENAPQTCFLSNWEEEKDIQFLLLVSFSCFILPAKTTSECCLEMLIMITFDFFVKLNGGNLPVSLWNKILHIEVERRLSSEEHGLLLQKIWVRFQAFSPSSSQSSVTPAQGEGGNLSPLGSTGTNTHLIYPPHHTHHF